MTERNPIQPKRFSRNVRELAELRRPVRIIGLTGGIASGKTVAADALKERGYTVIDADEISRALTAHGGKAERALMDMFPAAADGQKLDRRALRNIIASSPAEKKRLDEYMLPQIVGEIKAKLQTTVPPVVLSAPLLFETALGGMCDVTVCVTAPRRVRIERIAARDGVTKAQAEAMIDAQIPDTYRATLADFCVPSDTDLDTFRAETVELFDSICGKRPFDI